MAIINNKSLSFEQIRSDILDYLGSNVNTNPNKWLDTFSSGAGMTIAELIAGLASYISFAAMNSRREAFLDTAKFESSLYSMANLRGLSVSRPEAPKLVIQFENPIDCPSVIGTVNGAQLIAMNAHYTKDGASVKNTYDCYLGRLESTDEIYEDGIPISNPEGFYSLSVSPEQESGSRKFYIDNDIRNITVTVKRDDTQYYLKLTTNPEDLLRDSEDSEYADAIVRTTIDGVNIIFGGASSSVYVGSSAESMNFPIKTLYQDSSIIIAGSSERSLGLVFTKDGETWTSTNLREGRYTSVIKVDGTYYAASSDLNAVYYSLDAVTWDVSIRAGDGEFETFGHLTRLELNSGVPMVVVSSSNSGIKYKVDGSSDWLVCSMKTKSENSSGFSDYTGSLGNCTGIVACDKIAFATFEVHPFAIFYTGDGVTWLYLNPIEVFLSDSLNWRYALPTYFEYVHDRFFITRRGMGIFEFKPNLESYPMPKDDITEEELLEIDGSIATILFNQTMSAEGNSSVTTTTYPRYGRDYVSRSSSSYGVGTFNNITYAEDQNEFIAAGDTGLWVKSPTAADWSRRVLEEDNSGKLDTGLEIYTANSTFIQTNVGHDGGVSAVVFTPSGLGGKIVEESKSGVKGNTDDDYAVKISSLTFKNSSSSVSLDSSFIDLLDKAATQTNDRGNVIRILFKLSPQRLGVTGQVKINSVSIKSGDTGTIDTESKYWAYLWQRETVDNSSTLNILACSTTSVNWTGFSSFATWNFEPDEVWDGTITLEKQCGITFVKDTEGVGTPPEDFRDTADSATKEVVRISCTNKIGEWTKWEWRCDSTSGAFQVLAGMSVDVSAVDGNGALYAFVATAEKSDMEDMFINGDGTNTYPYSPKTTDGLSNLKNYPIRIKSVSEAGMVSGNDLIFTFNPDTAPVVMKDQTVLVYFSYTVSDPKDGVDLSWNDYFTINTTCYDIPNNDLGVGWVGVHTGNYNSVSNVLPCFEIKGTRAYDRTFRFSSSSYLPDGVTILGKEDTLDNTSLYDRTGTVFCFTENTNGAFIYADKTMPAIRAKFLLDQTYERAEQLSDETIVWVSENGTSYTDATIDNASSTLYIEGEPEHIGFPLEDGDKLSITYLSSNGRTGVSEVFASDVTLDIDNQILDVSYLDGGVRESVDKIRSLIPGYNSSYRRLVSRSDFIAHTLAARSDVFSANCYKCPYDCCTAVVPYLRGYLDGNGFVIRTGDSVKSNTAFNDYMEDRLYKYKMIGTEVSWQPAQETMLQPKMVITLLRGSDEDAVREEIRNIIISKIYKIGAVFSIGELSESISNIEGVVGVHIIKPNDDYKCTDDEYLASTYEYINSGILFKYDSANLTVDDDNSSGYVNSVPRLPLSYNRVSLDRGGYSESDTVIGPNDILINCGDDYTTEQLGATFMLVSDTEQVYTITPPILGGELPQDSESYFIPGIGSDGNQLRARFVSLLRDNKYQNYLRLYTNADSSVDVGAAEYYVSICAVGSDNITKTSIVEKLKIEVI